MHQKDCKETKNKQHLQISRINFLHPCIKKCRAGKPGSTFFSYEINVASGELFKHLVEIGRRDRLVFQRYLSFQHVGQLVFDDTVYQAFYVFLFLQHLL